MVYFIYQFHFQDTNGVNRLEIVPNSANRVFSNQGGGDAMHL